MFDFCKKNNKVLNGLFVALIGLCMVLPFVPELPSKAANETEIATVEDLELMRENPSGAFKLANDIDMAGVDWVPVDFKGSFDGNGYSILNCTVKTFGAETRTTYDGNYKEYDTSFAGFFGVLDNASVYGLNLVNIVVDVQKDGDAFVGGICGYSDNASISNCSVTGRLTLYNNGRMFGVAGGVGYGNGFFQQNTIDVTMVAIDTDDANRDESYLGGIIGAGYLDMSENKVTFDGYLSDAGYVHSGGIVGMYIFYPLGLTYRGTMTYNEVHSKIHFYENNTDRRAYCEPEFGEVMNWDFEYGWNDSKDFLRDEHKEYDKYLKPCMCADGTSKSESVTPATCTEYGYTTVKCDGCGYEYKDKYTLKSHNFDEGKVEKEATYDAAGSKLCKCKDCGAEQSFEIPKLVKEEPVVPTETDSSKDSDSKSESNKAMLVGGIFLIAFGGLMVVIGLKSKV